MSQAPPTAPRVPVAIGCYLALVQFCFALTWVVYVIYLPQLVEAAGLPRSVVPWLLMVDQLVFIVCDVAVGLASDRAATLLGRLGRWMVAATLLSMAAFVALPFVAPGGSPVLLLGLTLVWAASSSLLRAPPMTLLGRYAATPQQPVLVALLLLGSGVASALAPYLGLVLKGWDARGPFVLSSLSLAAVTLGMVAAERALARSRAARPAATLPGPAPQPTVRAATPVAGFMLAALLAAGAFQLQANVVHAPAYLQHADASQLPWLMPLFWVGFNLAMLPASLLTRRWGGLPVMAAAALGAAWASVLGWAAGGLALLVGAQVLAGACWAAVLMSAFSSALWFGHTGREGRLAGGLNAVLAAASLSRLGLVATLAPAPAVAAGWGWLAALGFAGAAAWLAAIGFRTRR